MRDFYAQSEWSTTVRAALREILPYAWRRFLVRIWRKWQPAKAALPVETATIPYQPTGDFYRSLTLLPHLPPSQREAVLARSAQEQEWLAPSLSLTPPAASIIIVSYNNLALTKLCLASVLRHTTGSFEVIVVDNASTDTTPEFLQALARAQPEKVRVLLQDENLGFARANNLALAQARSDLFVLLNNDAIVTPDWLPRLSWHLRDEAVGMVGPLTNHIGNEAQIRVPYHTWAELEGFALQRAAAGHQQAAEIPMLAMFCVAFRRDVYENVGALDEQYATGMFEDDDYALRVRRQGYNLLCAADAFVHHFGQAAFGKLVRSGQYDRLFDENRRRFETKWQIQWQPHRQRPLAFLPHAWRDGESAVEPLQVDGSVEALRVDG
jgi:GT2 family glycosyltransferase